jgi:hypothetical protein
MFHEAKTLRDYERNEAARGNWPDLWFEANARVEKDHQQSSSNVILWSMVHTIVFVNTLCRSHVISQSRSNCSTIRVLVFGMGLSLNWRGKYTINWSAENGHFWNTLHTPNDSNRSSSRDLNTQQESLCQKAKSFSTTDITFQCVCTTVQIPYNPTEALYKHGMIYVIRFVLCYKFGRS